MRRLKTGLKAKTIDQLVALFNNCALNDKGEFDYEGEDGELMAKIEQEIDSRIQ